MAGGVQSDIALDLEPRVIDQAMPSDYSYRRFAGCIITIFTVYLRKYNYKRNIEIQ